MRYTVLILLATTAIAWAHNPERPDLNDWFSHLQSRKGPCCTNNDGDALKDNEWRSTNGHYEVLIKDKWVVVDEPAVVTEPNKFGRTMVWIYYINGMPVVRCFMPGSMI